MRNNKTYHFTVPNTKVEYTVKLGYEGDFIRSFEVSNIIVNNRPCTEQDLSLHDRERYFEHLSNKIRNISLIAR